MRSVLVFGKWCSDCKASLKKHIFFSYHHHLCRALRLGWSWGFMCNNKQGKLEPKSQGSWCLTLTDVSSVFAFALQASWSSMQRGCFARAGWPMVSLGSTRGFQHRLPWLSLCRSRLFLSMLCLLLHGGKLLVPLSCILKVDFVPLSLSETSLWLIAVTLIFEGF